MGKSVERLEYRVGSLCRIMIELAQSRNQMITHTALPSAKEHDDALGTNALDYLKYDPKNAVRIMLIFDTRDPVGVPVVSNCNRLVIAGRWT